MKLLRKLYDWVLHWADTPYGVIALVALAFSESSFFPVPPDVLLIALCLGIPKRSFAFAFYCSLASILGGVAGYLIGWGAYELIGRPIMEFIAWLLHSDAATLLQEAQSWFSDPKTVFGVTTVWGPWAVGVAGFTPIPYKVFTIAAGFFKMNFLFFLIASAVSRSLRFFLVGLLIWTFGPPVKRFIDRYFNLLSILFVLLLIGGFIVMGLFLK